MNLNQNPPHENFLRTPLRLGKVQQLQLNLGKWEKLQSNLGENKNV